jgi:hypothetical protein
MGAAARRARVRALLLAALLAAPPARASNWAQVGGWNRQNTVWSAPPPQNLTRRYAFGSAVHQQHRVISSIPVVPPAAGASPSPSPVPIFNAPSKLFVMGGDSFTVDKSADATHGTDMDGTPLGVNFPAMDMAAPATGAGSLLNDIYWTHGARWVRVTDFHVLTPAGDPAPHLVSAANWTAVRPWAGLGDLSWKDYLGCNHPTHPFPCSTLQNVQEDGTDPQAAFRRWSPRRGFAALSVPYPDERPSDLIVIGGRARTYETIISADDVRGGLQTAWGSGVQAGPTTPGLIQRERLAYVNDVWISHDDGETWDFNNAGCWGAPLPGRNVPMNSKEYTLFPGGEQQTCSVAAVDPVTGVNADCFRKLFGRSTVCDASRSKDPAVGTCVCAHFSPREHFAAGVISQDGQTSIFVSGGIGAKQFALCGALGCGVDQSYVFEDTWRSADLGVSWSLMSLPSIVVRQGAARARGRAGARAS